MSGTRSLQAERLKKALQPLAVKGVTVEEAYEMIWASSSATRQGISIDHLFPDIMAEVFSV